MRRWTSIEDCPHGRSFIAVLKLGWRIKIKSVYVHTDDHFLSWKQLKYFSNKTSIGKWKCICWMDLIKK